MTGDRSRILVGVDFSPSSERALSYAVQLAKRLGAQLDLAHVYEVPVIGAPEAMPYVPDEAAILAQVKREMQVLRDRIVAEQVPAETYLRAGEPVSALLELIGELLPEVLVVGSHGRGLIMRVLLGSVSEQLCRRSPVPVLVVPAPERAAALKGAPDGQPRSVGTRTNELQI